MLSVLASGTLIRDPQARTAQNGNLYATALMRCPAEDADPLLISVITFSESTVEALLMLRQGDALSVAGRGKLSRWERNGEQNYGLSVVADRVLTAYQAAKVRKARARPKKRHESDRTIPGSYSRRRSRSPGRDRGGWETPAFLKQRQARR